ncbi:MAG: hypothetical protein R6W90_15115 [Ignavibacteriaceae bacterium]
MVLFNYKIYPQLLSFPGAEGYGKYTSGGRGGKVIEVTNLNDKGDGSFRNAVEQAGARIVVFRISGTIALESDLIIRNGDLTIAGQTAPGGGICIKNYQTIVNAGNVIIRFLRFRLGDETKQEADALNIMNSKNVIIDHCSVSWGIDEVFSFYDNENTTMQWCIISEALNDSYHSKGEHGYGGIWGGKNATFHHNLLANNSSRNPRFNGSRTKYTSDEELVDFRNNVIYNWGINSAYGGEGGSYNIAANYYKPGPATEEKVKSRIIEPWENKGRWYIDGNYVAGSPEVTEDNWKGGVQGDFSEDDIKADKPFETMPVEYSNAEEAYEDVLRYAGAILPVRDNADERIINDVMSGTVSAANGIINSQTQVGGWPELQSTEAPADTDHDGMPDNWEQKRSLNIYDSSDANKIAESGYTYIEEYLNELVKIKYSDIKGCNCGNKYRKIN